MTTVDDTGTFILEDDEAEAPEAAAAKSPLVTTREWVQANSMKIFWLCVILSIPYFLTCYAVAMIAAFGQCGGG